MSLPLEGLTQVTAAAESAISPVFTLWITLVIMFAGKRTPRTDCWLLLDGRKARLSAHQSLEPPGRGLNCLKQHGAESGCWL